MKPQKHKPLDIEEKRARDQLTYITNKVKGEWSFGKLITFEDLLKCYGEPNIYSGKYFPSELEHILTFQDVKDFLSDKHIELSTYFWLQKNPPLISYSELNSSEVNSTNTSTDIPAILTKDFTRKSYEDTLEQAALEYAKRLPKLKRRKCSLLWFQKKAVVEIIDNIQQGHSASLLISPTGSGKTIIAGDLICWLIETKFAEGKTYTPWPIVYVTKTPVVEQTKYDLREFWGITPDECLVVGIDQLRSSFGQRFLKEDIIVEEGIEHIRWVWRENLKPVGIIWDECQALKNTYSQQSQIAQAFNEEESEDIKKHFHNRQIIQVFMSATPGTRVSEFKCFCVATRVPYTFGIIKNAPLVNQHWSDFAKNIASDYGTKDIQSEDHSPGAVDRLMNYMEKYIIRVKGIRSQFKAYNSIRVMDFETDKGRSEYTNAWEIFEQEKAKLEGSKELTSAQITFNILAQLTVFLKAAETNIDRINIITREMYHNVIEGYAACCAVRYKLTICKCVETLITKYNVPRDKISLIWGGAPVANKKQRIKQKIVGNDAVAKILEEQGITLDDLDLEDVDEIVEKYPKEWRLGPQNVKERQKEIERYQKGESLYCFYTFRAGGVGLSLHHTDKLTKEKVRHKDSGYAYEEDIPKIPTRPRRNIVAPTWSAIELVQGVGRCPRITSLSDTHQVMLFFRGTVEERQAKVVGMKLHCLTKVVRNRESWEDLIVGRKGMTDEQVEHAHLTDSVDKIHQQNENNEDEEDSGTWTGDEEEE